MRFRYDGQKVIAADSDLYNEEFGQAFTGEYDTLGNMTKKRGVNDGKMTEWRYTYDGENRLIKAVEYSATGTATGKQSQFTYDHTGERVKKVYQSKEASGNTTTVTTYYFGDTFEIRHVHQPWELQQDVWTSTKYVQSPGHGKIASITRGYQLPQSSIAALYGIPTETGIGNGFNLPTSLEDIGRMHSFQGTGWFAKSSRSIRLSQGLILVAIGGLIFLLFWNGHDPKQLLFRSSFVPWQRLVAINMLLVFMITGCQGDRDFGTAPSATAPTSFEQLPAGILYNVAGTTADGVPEGVHFYHQNHINSSSVITNLNGDVVSRYVYEAFGELIQDRSWGINTVTHKFTSQELDEETDLMYYGARYYDPSIGRFLTADTIVPDPTDAQTFNRYAYVINNPIKYTDPTGHAPESNPNEEGQTGESENINDSDEIADPVGPQQEVGRAYMERMRRHNTAVNEFLECKDDPNNLKKWEKLIKTLKELKIKKFLVMPMISYMNRILMDGPITAAMSEFDSVDGLVNVDALDTAMRAVEYFGIQCGIDLDAIREGREREAWGLKKLGLKKNTIPIYTEEGCSIPDALTDTLLVEIKHTKSIRLNKQLRIQTTYAQENGIQSILITGVHTKVHEKVLKAFDEVRRWKGLGPKKTQ